MQELQNEREVKLITILKNRLQTFVEGSTDEFIKWANLEARRLSQAGNFYFFYNPNDLLYYGHSLALNRFGGKFLQPTMWQFKWSSTCTFNHMTYLTSHATCLNNTRE